jgi:hypothetical protein
MFKHVVFTITVVAVVMIGAMFLLSDTRLSPIAMRPVVRAADPCSDRGLDGGYAFYGDGVVTQAPAGFAAGPLAEVGLWKFYGNGQFDGKATAALNGAIYDLSVYGSYQVDADCTVNITINTAVEGHAGPVLHARGVIADENRELAIITSDPGFVQYRKLRRQFGSERR